MARRTSRIHPALCLVATLWITRAPALAQVPFVASPAEPARHLKDGKVLHALRIAAESPVIDGSLTDQAWTLAETAGGFLQRDPDNGNPMTEATRVQVAYDDRFLYIAVVCDDGDATRIAAGLGRRDEFPSSDYVGIALDPRHDHLTGYLIETNPSGVQRDYSISDDDQFDLDYNAVWEVRTQLGDRGWTAEFRVPFSQLRFTASPDPGQVWGMNARRQVRRKSELGTWVAKPRGERGEVSLFGHLVFDAPIAAPRRIELTPYVLSRADRPADGAASTASASAGADLRVGLGQGATLSATVNPDFGQVEQDPAVLNLSVFETFFPEKRAFFLEDNKTFIPSFGLFQVFHSRRIGADDTTILGAAKITGKSGAWTYGGLSALTDHNRAADRPLTSFNVVRLQRDVLNGSSTIGAIASGVVRERPDDAFTGGVDFTLRFDDKRNVLNGHWIGTRAPGAGGLKTSGGGTSNFSVSHKHWSTYLHVDHFGRDFRVNDIGFLRARINRNEVDVSGNLEQPDPWKIFRNMLVNLGSGGQWTVDGLPIGRYSNVSWNVQFSNFWHVNGGTGVNRKVFDDLDTRGGPPIVRPGNRFFYFSVSSDSRRSWKVNFGRDRNGNQLGGYGESIYANVTAQPLKRLQSSVAVRYERGREIAQWLENRDTDGDGKTDHVYGTLHRNVVDVTVRGTYAFSRDLTLQAYLQPFVAAGDYQNIRRLARPRSYEFEPVTLGTNPDFNQKSARGNVVLRWEYLRGSTLFVVWNLTQSNSTRPGDFRAVRDIGRAFSADASHTFLVKVSYWLNRLKRIPLVPSTRSWYSCRAGGVDGRVLDGPTAPRVARCGCGSGV